MGHIEWLRHLFWHSSRSTSRYCFARDSGHDCGSDLETIQETLVLAVRVVHDIAGPSQLPSSGISSKLRVGFGHAYFECLAADHVPVAFGHDWADATGAFDVCSLEPFAE